MKRFTKKDALFLLFLAVFLAGAFLIRALFFTTPGDRVVIEVGEEVVGEYPLDKDREIEIKNKEGEVTNTLQIKEGKAKMIDAACPDHLCMKQKAIDRDGETIICLPNQVVVRVAGTKEKALDAVAQ